MVGYPSPQPVTPEDNALKWGKFYKFDSDAEALACGTMLEEAAQYMLGPHFGQASGALEAVSFPFIMQAYRSGRFAGWSGPELVRAARDYFTRHVVVEGTAQQGTQLIDAILPDLSRPAPEVFTVAFALAHPGLTRLSSPETLAGALLAAHELAAAQGLRVVGSSWGA